MLVKVESELKHRVLGSTVDDAAGECFDKTRKLWGCRIPPGRKLTGWRSRGIQRRMTSRARCFTTRVTTQLQRTEKPPSAIFSAIIRGFG